MHRDAGLIHQHFNFVDLIIGAGADQKAAQGVVVPADDLLLGSISTGFIVTDTVSGHIYTHVSRGFIRLVP